MEDDDIIYIIYNYKLIYLFKPTIKEIIFSTLITEHLAIVCKLLNDIFFFYCHKAILMFYLNLYSSVQISEDNA